MVAAIKFLLTSDCVGLVDLLLADASHCLWMMGSMGAFLVGWDAPEETAMIG